MISIQKRGDTGGQHPHLGLLEAIREIPRGEGRINGAVDRDKKVGEGRRKQGVEDMKR